MFRSSTFLTLPTMVLWMIVGKVSAAEPGVYLTSPKGTRPYSIKIAEVENFEIPVGKMVDVVAEFGQPAHAGIALTNVKLLAVDSRTVQHAYNRVLLALTPAQEDFVRLVEKIGTALSIKVYERGKSKPKLASPPLKVGRFGLQPPKGYSATAVGIANADEDMPREGLLPRQDIDVFGETSELAGNGVAFLNVSLLACDSRPIGQKSTTVLVALTPIQMDVYKLMLEHEMKVSVKVHEQDESADEPTFGTELPKGKYACSLKIAEVVKKRCQEPFLETVPDTFSFLIRDSMGRPVAEHAADALVDLSTDLAPIDRLLILLSGLSGESASGFSAICTLAGKHDWNAALVICRRSSVSDRGNRPDCK